MPSDKSFIAAILSEQGTSDQALGGLLRMRARRYPGGMRHFRPGAEERRFSSREDLPRTGFQELVGIRR